MIPTAAGPRDPTTWLPQNTSVDIVRRLELRGSGRQTCGVLAVRIVDAGGAVEPGMVLAVRADLVVAQPSGPSPTEGLKRKLTEVKAARERAAAEKQRAVAASKERLDEEIRSGRCHADSVSALRPVLNHLTTTWFPTNPSSVHIDGWVLLGHRFEVASDAPFSLTIGSSLGGETHVFSVGRASTALVLKDGQGYPVTMSSPYAAHMGPDYGMSVVGRQVQASTAEKLTVDVTGHGCVLVVAFQKP